MAAEQVSIAVIGSLNVDLITRTKRIPGAGETLTSEAFDIGFGGKGANQAVACARLSRTSAQAAASESTDVRVQMIGAVGSDPFAKDFKQSLNRDGLDTSKIQVIEGEKTGTAVIVVEEDTGENRIMFYPGANSRVDAQDLLPAKTDVAVFQLEIPPQVVFETIEISKTKGISVVFNPAPAIELPEHIYNDLDHLIVNETEAALITGKTGLDLSTQAQQQQLADEFLHRGVKHMIITLGADGVFYRTSEQLQMNEPGVHIAAQQVKAVDTTAAGDTFVGAYSVALARAKSQPPFDVSSAITYANRAAALTVQRKGAQAAIPWLDEVA